MMFSKNLILSFLVPVSLLLSIALSSEATAATPAGFHYRKIFTPAGQLVHILEVDLKEHRLELVPASNHTRGLATLAHIAKQHGALAAINGGFFKSGNQAGLPAGILKIQKNWYQIAYQARGAMGWSDTAAIWLMDRIQTKTTLVINEVRYPIYALNQAGLSQKAILYTKAYGQTPDSRPLSYHIVVDNNRVVALGAGINPSIPANGFVYVRGPHMQQPTGVSLGDLARLEIEILPQTEDTAKDIWQKVDNIIGGAPLLVKNGKSLQNFEQEHLPSEFINSRLARTAIGLLPNGNCLLVVSERNSTEDSAGMTLPELATFMQQQGCLQALNLDGGSSSSLYLDDSFGIKEPISEDSWPNNAGRPISNALVILPKIAP